MKLSHASTIEAANQALMVDGDLEAIPEYFSSAYVTHLTDETVTGGHSTVRRVLEMYQRAFGNIKVEVVVLIENEDRVAWQRTIRATHKGKFRNFPATRRAIVWRDMVVSRFEDGLIVEEWLATDLAERLLLARKK